MDKCNLCPRMCNVDREKYKGYCNMSDKIKVARSSLHMWEEPCISGKNGSGAVFFSGCSLKCVFCQNYEISHQGFGKEITVYDLAEIFKELERKNANNINLVTPTHFVPGIIKALDIAKPKIPVLYNTGGYERIETIRKLKGYIDIYLPDLKYFDNERALRYSSSKDYFDVTIKAIKEMVNQVGKIKLDENNIMKKGVIIRHMVMPGGYKDSLKLMEYLGDTFKKDEIMISLMSQYYPAYKAKDYPEINRRVTTFEYNKVLSYVEKLPFDGFMQERTSALKEYTPKFDLTGVK